MQREALIAVGCRAPSGPYTTLSHADYSGYLAAADSPDKPGDTAQIFGPLGAPALVLSKSKEDWLCNFLLHATAHELLPRFRQSVESIGLMAELLYAADEINDFEKVIQIYPEASKHILGITFSTTPEILELAQHRTRSILSKVAALDALA